MLASVPPADGDLAVLGPNHGRGLLAYTTESHLRVWVWMTMLPEGQSPDSEAVIYGTPRFETVNAEIYGTSPKSAKQRWRGRFDSIADQPGLFELRVPKGLTHAAIDLMHDSKSGFTQGLSGTC